MTWDDRLDRGRYYGRCMGCGAEHVLGHGKAGWMTLCPACCVEHRKCGVCREWLLREWARAEERGPERMRALPAP